jgi:hypothetical protein
MNQRDVMRTEFAPRGMHDHALDRVVRRADADNAAGPAIPHRVADMARGEQPVRRDECRVPNAAEGDHRGVPRA